MKVGNAPAPAIVVTNDEIKSGEIYVLQPILWLSTFNKCHVTVKKTLLTYSKNELESRFLRYSKNKLESRLLTNSKNNLESFFLAPLGTKENAMMVITQVGSNYLTLALNQIKTRNEFNEIVNVDNNKINTGQIKFFKQITLKFDSPKELQEWTKCVAAECSTNYLEDYFKPWLVIPSSNYTVAQFVKKLNEEVWGRILLSPDEFEALRIILTFMPASSEYKFVQKIMQRCIRWIYKLLSMSSRDVDESLCSIFLLLLHPALNNYLFRTILVMIEPDDKFVTDYCRSEDCSQTNLVYELVKWIVGKVKIDDEVKDKCIDQYFFLQVVEHPYAPKQLDMNTSDIVPNSLENLKDNKEQVWWQSCPSYTFSFAMFTDILNTGAAFTFHLLMGFIKNVIDDEGIGKILNHLHNMPDSYQTVQIISIYTAVPVKYHFKSLIKYCQYREMWKILCRDGYLNVEAFPIHKPFIDTAHKQLWARIVVVEEDNDEPLVQMFLPKSISKKWSIHEFVHALHSELLVRLVQKELLVTKAFTIKNVELKIDSDVTDSKEGEHDALLVLFAGGMSRLLDRIRLWMQQLTGRTALQSVDAIVFVELLTAVSKDPYFRAFLMLFLPTSDALSQYVGQLNDGKDSIRIELHSVQFVHTISQDMKSLKSPQFQSFLDGAGFPKAIIENKISATWENECKWYEQIEEIFHVPSPWFLDWYQIKAALTETPAAAFTVVMSRYKAQNPLESIAVCKQFQPEMIQSLFLSSFSYDRLLSDAVSASILSTARHFNSLLNYCRVRFVWTLIDPSNKLLAKDNPHVGTLHRELWQVMERTRGKSQTKSNDGLLQLFSCQTSDSIDVIFGTVIPMLICHKMRNKDDLAYSLFTMLKIDAEQTTNYVRNVDDEHIQQFIKFVETLWNWVVSFLGDTDASLNTIPTFVNLLGACTISPIIRALVVVCRPVRGIGNCKIDNCLLNDLLMDAVERILKNDNQANEMIQGLIFCFWWFKHPFAQFNSSQSFTLTCGSWKSESEWLFDDERKPWQFDGQYFQLLLQQPSYLPFKTVSKQFVRVDDRIVDQLIEEVSHVPMILRKNRFKFPTTYLPYNIAKDLEVIEDAHFDKLVEFALFRELWKISMTQTLDAEAGNATFAQQVIVDIWRQIDSSDDSVFREFFLPKKSDMIWIHSTFKSLLQRKSRKEMIEKKETRLSKLIQCLFDSSASLPNAGSPAHAADPAGEVPPSRIGSSSGDCHIASLSDEEINIGSFELLVNQICEWTTACGGGKKIFDPSDAPVFQEILFNALQDVGFRAFISKFIPTDDCVAQFSSEFVKNQHLFDPQPNFSVEFIRFISSSLRSELWSPYRRFMKTLGLKSVEGTNRLSMQQEPPWSVESIWLEQILTSKDILLSWRQLKYCFEPTPYLIWLIAADSHESHQIEALKSVLPTDLNAKFNIVKYTHDEDNNLIETILYDNHFIALCLEDNGIIFSLFLDQRQLTNEYFEALVRLAFQDDLSPKLRRLYIIMKEIMFPKGDLTKKFNVEVLSTIPSFGRIVIEEIYRAIKRETFKRDTSTLCEMMALVFRLEGIRGHDNTSASIESFASRKVESENRQTTAKDSTYAKSSNVSAISELMIREPSFRDKVFGILKEITFSKWFARECERAKSLFGPNRTINKANQETLVEESSTRITRKSVHNTRRSFMSPLVTASMPSRIEIEENILNFVYLCLQFQPQYFTEYLQELGIGRPFFTSFFHREDPLYNRLLQVISRVLQLPSNSIIKQYLDDGLFMYDNDHMTSIALECISLSGRGSHKSNSCNINEQQFAEFIVVALYLHNFDNLKNRIEKILDWLLQDSDRLRMTEKLFRWMIDIFIEPDLATNNTMQRARWKYGQTFAWITLEDIVDCAQQATVATQLLRGSEFSGAHQSLENLFYHYFTKNRPSLWCSLFTQSKSIAYFIKYVDREDLRIAYNKFTELNYDNRRFLFHLNRVKKLLSKPIVSATELVNLTTNHAKNGLENIKKFLASLLRKAKHLNSNYFDLKLILRLTAIWMQASIEKIGIPLPPRNAQFITVLTCASWAKCLLINKDESQGKTLIAQVGTGEGKSLIIAMMAIYFVKILKRSVHILENNLGLLEKDYKQLQPFYQKFNIIPRLNHEITMATPSLSKTSLDALNRKDCRDEFPEFGITYCLRRNLERYYQDCIMNGIEKPFLNTTLIVDEVDDLIVDEAPNQPSSCRDIEEPEFVKACQFYKTKDPNEEADETSFVWELAHEASLAASQYKEKEHYERQDDQFFLLDERGNRVDVYDYNLEYLKPNPQLKTKYYFQSIPYMLSQYECITGFSGSLGSPSEREYLEKQYKAWCFDTPSYLNTCKNIVKVPPQLLTEEDGKYLYQCVHVMPTKLDQRLKVIQIAARMYLHVPVLIIAGSTDEAYIFANEIEEYLVESPHKGFEHERSLLDGMDVKDYVQLFLQYVKGTLIPDKGNWVRIMSRATTRSNDRFPITITDSFGGRGHDFDVHDDEVERHGGLLVIMTSIPASDREWRQWKGRTGRRDNSGQYAVVLSSEDTVIKQAKELGVLRNYQLNATTDTRYTELIINQLLDLQDNAQKEKLKKSENIIFVGRRLNYLCDQFYSQFGSMNEFNWPGTTYEVLLRNLLTNPMTRDSDIDEIFQQLGLPEIRVDKLVRLPPFIPMIESDAEDDESNENSDDEGYQDNAHNILLLEEDDDDYDISNFQYNPTPKWISINDHHLIDNEPVPLPSDIMNRSKNEVTLHPDQPMVNISSSTDKQVNVVVPPIIHTDVNTANLSDNIQVNIPSPNELSVKSVFGFEELQTIINNDNINSRSKMASPSPGSSRQSVRPIISSTKVDRDIDFSDDESDSLPVRFQRRIPVQSNKDSTVSAKYDEERRSSPTLPKGVQSKSGSRSITNNQLVSTSLKSTMNVVQNVNMKRPMNAVKEIVPRTSDQPIEKISDQHSLSITNKLPEVANKQSSSKSMSKILLPQEVIKPIINRVVSPKSTNDSVGVLSGGGNKQASSTSQSAISSKSVARLENAAKRIQSTNNLSSIRIGETKVINLRPTEELNNKLSFLKKSSPPEILTSYLYTNDNSNNDNTNHLSLIINSMKIEGIIQKRDLSYSITITLKLSDLQTQYDITLYGKKQLILSCHNIEIVNQIIEIKPSLSAIPFSSYTFHNATNDIQLTDNNGKILFTYYNQYNEEIISTLPLSTQEIVFPTNDFPNCIVHINHDIPGYMKKHIQHVYYEKELHNECSHVFLSSNDLDDNEWRIILKWNQLPEDLDLFCLTSMDEPNIIYWEERNQYGRKDRNKGMIELDIDVKTGKGPETITFTPLLDVHYRFVVHNCSYYNDKQSIPLIHSGAKISIFQSNGNYYEYSVPEEDDFNEFHAEYWHVFDVVNGKITEFNIVTNQSVLDVPLNETPSK